MTFRYHSDKTQFQCFLQTTACQVCGSETYVAPICPRHAAEQFGVAVRPSLIPNAGLGLFTLRAFAKGDLLTPPYTGEVLTQDELNARYKNGSAPYVLEIKKDMYADAACVRSWAAFINHAPRGKCNAKFSIYRSVANVRATRDIPAGSEILIDYCEDYFINDNSHTDTVFPKHFEEQIQNPFGGGGGSGGSLAKRQRSKSPPGSSRSNPIVI